MFGPAQRYSHQILEILAALRKSLQAPRLHAWATSNTRKEMLHSCVYKGIYVRTDRCEELRMPQAWTPSAPLYNIKKNQALPIQLGVLPSRQPVQTASCTIRINQNVAGPETLKPSNHVSLKPRHALRRIRHSDDGHAKKSAFHIGVLGQEESVHRVARDADLELVTQQANLVQGGRWRFSTSWRSSLCTVAAWSHIQSRCNPNTHKWTHTT